jgi:6-methylsalicylate decarboxylase
VYTHPKSCTACAQLVPGLHDSVVEYGADTARAIGRMVFSGSSSRYADLRMIWSHGGGTMPYLVNRFINFARGPAYRELLPDGFLPEARRFFYDTAQVAIRPALLALKEVAGPDNILFGTDFPWGDIAGEARALREAGVFAEDELVRIERGNALRCVPSLASRVAA